MKFLQSVSANAFSHSDSRQLYSGFREASMKLLQRVFANAFPFSGPRNKEVSMVILQMHLPMFSVFWSGHIQPKIQEVSVMFLQNEFTNASPSSIIYSILAKCL